jgi:hypothetical protein
MPGSRGVKTFLKVLLGALGVLLAIKLLPRIIGLGVAVIGGVVGLLGAALGLGVAALAGLLGIATVLAPLWVPIALIAGIVVLCRRKKNSAA